MFKLTLSRDPALPLFALLLLVLLAAGCARGFDRSLPGLCEPKNNTLENIANAISYLKPLGRPQNGFTIVKAI